MRLLWAREGSAQLARVKKDLAGVSVDAVTRLFKASQATDAAWRINKLEGLLKINVLDDEWQRGDKRYNDVLMNKIVMQEL